METTLVYVHVGKTLPVFNELLDSIYQTILINHIHTKVYVITNDKFINVLKEKVKKFDLRYFKSEINISLIVNFIPTSILEKGDKLQKYNDIQKNKFNEKEGFRDSFWISTTKRFFYIEEFIKLYHINNIFHIENDVMLYENLSTFTKSLDEMCMYMAKDSKSRVIPSILFIKKDILSDICDYIISTLLNGNLYLNDMELLGKFTHKSLKYFNLDLQGHENYIVDGAAIGQYLGGVDPRNFKSTSIEDVYNNPTRGFINETCDFKINKSLEIFKKAVYLDHLNIPINVMYIKKRESYDLVKIINLHIHCKQLYQFSSIFDIKYYDIISGDKVCKLCDYVLVTPQIYNYHKYLDNFVKLDKIVVVKDINKVNMVNFNNIMEESGKEIVRLFIYTHFLEEFINNILPRVSTKQKYVLYIHNSDHSLTKKMYSILKNNKSVIKVYSQNINCEFDDTYKFNLLPIGVQNMMWNENGILNLYKVMSKTYNVKKVNNLYININENTFKYRKTVMNIVREKGLQMSISSKKEYSLYLEELSSHYFCLCPRGNGIDTHRFWEALYLGVIPVIIVNENTQMDNFVKYLVKLNVPFYVVDDINKEKYNDGFFNESLYNKTMQKLGNSFENYKISDYVVM